MNKELLIIYSKMLELSCTHKPKLPVDPYKYKYNQQHMTSKEHLYINVIKQVTPNDLKSSEKSRKIYNS